MSRAVLTACPIMIPTQPRCLLYLGLARSIHGSTHDGDKHGCKCLLRDAREVVLLLACLSVQRLVHTSTRSSPPPTSALNTTDSANAQSSRAGMCENERDSSSFRTSAFADAALAHTPMCINTAPGHGRTPEPTDIALENSTCCLAYRVAQCLRETLRNSGSHAIAARTSASPMDKCGLSDWLARSAATQISISAAPAQKHVFAFANTQNTARANHSLRVPAQNHSGARPLTPAKQRLSATSASSSSHMHAHWRQSPLPQQLPAQGTARDCLHERTRTETQNARIHTLTRRK